ncbi:MAG TPA: YXWGXW repeat-containing protein [Candidatus Udaeobacter sp.]|nr:YXWGXW repeat-containing protein [Candidatus Udaeobacter sp.]
MNRSIIRWVILGTVILFFSVASFGQIAVGVSVRIGPPPLPVYAQPICPGPGFIWTPGYWAWDDDDGYYWVPGTWVVAPVGMLWTPGYWGWGGGFYLWHAGYWGSYVGFYGGINYGFGYGGVGFGGGEWRGRSFYYNRSVTNVSVTNVTNVYNRTVVVNNRTTTSFNGGTGGVHARPSRQEEEFGRERHTAALDVQTHHERAAAGNRENLASQNHGRPAIAATARPGDFSRHAAVPARAAGGEYHAPALSPKQARVNPSAANRANSMAGAMNNNKARSNEGYRPFTPPAKNNGANSRTNENYNRNPGSSSNRGNENRYNESRPPQQHQEAAPPRQAPRPAPQQHSSPPPQRQAPPPQRQAPPPQRQAPQPQHQAPPPQHQAPQPQHQAPQPQHHAPPPGSHHGKGL